MRTDDFRYLLHVSRSGRLRDAAMSLGVDETTVSRRISRLENDLGVRLFDRAPQGWRLTEAGAQLLPHIEGMELYLARALEAISSPRGELTGTVRVLAPDGFGVYVLIPGLKQMLETHPLLNYEVRTATRQDLITARDFDVAVTLERPSTKGAAVTRLADYELRFYASEEYLSKWDEPQSIDDLRARHTLIWYVDVLLDVQPLRFLDDLIPSATTRLQSTNIAGHHSAARAGLGIAPLPAYVGESDPALREVLPELLRTRRTYWMVVPRDLAALHRVQETAAAIQNIVREHPHLSAAHPARNDAS